MFLENLWYQNATIDVLVLALSIFTTCFQNSLKSKLKFIHLFKWSSHFVFAYQLSTGTFRL